MNDDFEAFAKKSLHQLEEATDARTRARLAAVRRQALAGEPRPRQIRRFRWFPATALATAVAALLLVWMLPHERPLPAGMTDSLEELDLLASDIDLETLEDIDFYLWLEEQNDASSGSRNLS